MAAISHAFSQMKIYVFWLNYSQQFVAKGPTDEESSSVQVKAWAPSQNKDHLS